MMILKDLLLQVPFKAVFTEIERIHKERKKVFQRKNMEPRYRMAYDVLKRTSPVLSDEVLSVGQDYCCRRNGGVLPHLLFTAWREWLGMEIESDTIETMPASTILACSIMEMTSYGFDEKIARKRCKRDVSRFNVEVAASYAPDEFNYSMDDSDMYYAKYQQDQELYSRSVAPMIDAIPITYAELKLIRDAGNLTPKAWYRITDYDCTTTQVDTKSAGHVFDIIVQAEDKCHLNERAFAANHEGDTYFEDSELESWRLWYCLDNDCTQYAWADVENGKGVIYRMIDEWGNDVPYDFKNIMFKRVRMSGKKESARYDNATFLYIEIPYQNKRIPKASKKRDTMFVYTFNGFENQDGIFRVFDMSLEKKGNLDDSELIAENRYGPINIKIGAKYKETWGEDLKRAFLNNIVFLQMDEYGTCYTLSRGCLNCTFEVGCFNMTIGAQGAYGLHFGVGCSHMILGTGCFGNGFGNECSHVYVGSHSSNNHFGKNCRDIYMEKSCSDNRFGEGCKECSLGTSCTSNNVGNSCREIVFGSNCCDNTIGNHCENVRYEKYCRNIIAFNCVGHCIVRGGNENKKIYVQNAQILGGTFGDVLCAELVIKFAVDKSYTQFAGLNSKGELRVWVPADIVD